MGNATAAKDFKDSGTGKSFFKGQAVDADAGEIENYRAAGLIEGEQPTAEQVLDAAAAPETKPAPRMRTRAKKAPASTPSAG